MLLSKTEYRRDIQCLRGLAVFSIILFHAYENFFALGYLGVDVFFVISGYVVTPLIIRVFTEQPISGGGLFMNLKYFYKRRFYRLVPALSASLVFFAFVILLVGSPQDHQRFAKQGIATLFLVGNLGAYRYSGDYFSPNPNPLVHTWSLSLEEQIYLFLPILLIIILYKSLKIVKVVTYAFILISFISFISFLLPTIMQPLYSLADIQIASQASFYSPIDRIWQFTLGGLAYLLLNKYSDKVLNISRIYHLALICGLLLLLLTPFQIGLKNSSVLATFLTLAVIMFRSLKYIPDYISTILEKLGNSSYSIYLVHMPILYLAKYSPVFELSIREDRLIQSTFGVIASIDYFLLYIGRPKIAILTASFLNAFLSLGLLLLFRIFVKHIFEYYINKNHVNDKTNIIIYGLDANAISVARALESENPKRFNVIGFIDKTKENIDKTILNLPIFEIKKSIPLIQYI